MDLVEFLKARLAKDEQVARACSGTSWVTAPSGRIQVDAPEGEAGYVASVENESYAEHIARQDPVRALREVEAKRRIVDEYEKAAWLLEQGRRDGQAEAAQAARHTVLRLLALAYADHPVYRDQWRP